jgi:TrmH family RNA methyltransferase
MLSNVRIILVEPSHPGNIGGVARAMKNMGLSQLTLVSPEKFPHSDATTRAAGADDVLNAAVVVDSLRSAITDCSMVLGASARLRTLSWPQLDPREAGDKIISVSQSSRVAVVFGRERTGLTNSELDLCQYLVHIPTNKNFSSLNLAAAVQVMAYEIFTHEQQISQPNATTKDESLASQQDVQRFYEHLEEVLIRIDFLDPAQPRKLMRRLRRLFNRAQPDDVEINILRGILTAVDKGVGK